MKDKKIINGHTHIPYIHTGVSSHEIEQVSTDFYKNLSRRRSIRDFSGEAVPKQVINNIIMTAATAPSGAHKQPWRFVAISDPSIKKQIRIAAEKEEKENYESRMSEQWLEDLQAMGTDMNKPFLETAPWLIVVFKQVYDVDISGNKKTNYYVNESVGIACGLLISAIHNAGLVTLTHTPSPMNFLSEILERPKNERPYLLFPVGYPAKKCYVPDIHRKRLSEISTFYTHK